jgi:hypothetical protein
MAFSCSQLPGPHTAKPNTSANTPNSRYHARQLPSTALRATDRQQQHTSSSNAAPEASLLQLGDAAAADASPLCVLLPNGRQFQIQMVVRRGSQPEWAFTGMAGAAVLLCFISIICFCLLMFMNANDVIQLPSAVYAMEWAFTGMAGAAVLPLITFWTKGSVWCMEPLLLQYLRA